MIRVSGNPTPAELAAVVAVLAASGGGAAPAPEPDTSRWLDRAKQLRSPLRPGPGAWRSTSS